MANDKIRTMEKDIERLEKGEDLGVTDDSMVELTEAPQESDITKQKPVSSEPQEPESQETEEKDYSQELRKIDEYITQVKKERQKLQEQINSLSTEKKELSDEIHNLLEEEEGDFQTSVREKTKSLRKQKKQIEKELLKKQEKNQDVKKDLHKLKKFKNKLTNSTPTHEK